MADGKKNRFSALAGKDKCEETECQLFEKTVAEAVEEALNKENDQKLTVSAKQPAIGKKKTGPPATTPTGAGDGGYDRGHHRATDRGYPADTHKVGDHGGYGGSGHCIQADARGAPGGRDNERGGRESGGEHGATASEITDTTFRPRQTGAV